MDYDVANGPGDLPSVVLKVIDTLENRVVSSFGATHVMMPVLSGAVDYTGLHQVVNRYGITIPGGTGPVIPTFGQIFPSGR